MLIISRIRKVKCDEEKPFCKRCTSTGRTCDGYDPNFRPSSHSPSASPLVSGQTYLQPMRELTRSISPVPLAPALRLSTSQERDSFEFFTTYAISSLRGFLDSPFWQREVLQAAHQHESIQRCIVALGAMHRRFFEGSNSHIKESDMSDQHLQFALRQSNQAIQGLLKAPSPGGTMPTVDKVTLMTCSVLFSSMACLQGHQKEGLAHLRSGIRMLNEVDQEEEDNGKTESHPIGVETLRSIFVSLDLQARSIMTAADASSWEPLPRTKEPTMMRSAEIDDRSLLAVQRYLESLLNHCLAWLLSCIKRPVSDTEDVHYSYRRLLQRFDHGTRLLERLRIKATHAAGDFSQSLAVLQLLHCQLEFLLRVPRPDFEAKFGCMDDPSRSPPREAFDLTAHFTKMLDLATQLLSHTPSASPIFTTTSGPLSALWLIAMRAPSTCIALRKRAVKFMLSYPRREGFWDGLLAGQIAKELMRIEQESTKEELGLFLGEDQDDLVVPDDLRIIAVEINYVKEEERKAKVGYRSVRNMAEDTPGRVQYVTW